MKIQYRAPDGQPTENIRQCLDHEKQQLEFWEQCRVSEQRALKRSMGAIMLSKDKVAEWEERLATRLKEEAAAQEVNGL